MLFRSFFRQSKPIEEEEKPESAQPSDTELSTLERDCCRQNFMFYDKQKVGWVERFELPMLLTTCGYNLPDETIL